MKNYLLFLTLIFSAPVFSTTTSVTSLGDAGTGSLREIINTATAGDTIDFLVAGTITLSGGEIIINKDLVILSSGPANLTLSGNSSNRILNITGGNVFISSVSFENGVLSGSGGAIQNSSPDTVTIEKSVFNSCAAGIDGGGIKNTGMFLRIIDCTFTNNHAGFDGGGLYSSTGLVTIIGSTFNGNSCSISGAGIRTVGGTCKLINSTLSGNNATVSGGGFEGILDIMNSTITENNSQNGGGAKTTGAVFQNTIVYNNHVSGNSPDIAGPINSNGNNIFGDTSGCSGAIFSDLININPMLDILGLNGGYTATHAIMSTSPAIDAGTCLGAPSTDQRDINRVGFPDIGAYEFGGTPFVINQISESICNGDVYVFGNQNLDTAGVYMETFQTLADCDSTVELTLSIKQIYNETANATICIGDSLIFGSLTLLSSGTYTEQFSSSLNCDSTVELTLTVTEPDITVSQSGKTLSAAGTAESYQWIDCNTNQIIPNDTSRVFIALANGQYAVIVTENGCSDTSACYNVTTVGIATENFSSGISVYPTMVKSKTSVRFIESQKFVNIILMDISGREIHREKYSETNTLTLDLSICKPGNYFIQVESGEKNSIHRVVKIE
ncbi:MAG: T9SS type A sorting domain-containing protein [Bacteroidetes bacterium]|nr:MAG: T9SS type A sorting domain-containing protein [Bacteroidota bacterium]